MRVRRALLLAAIVAQLLLSLADSPALEPARAQRDPAPDPHQLPLPALPTTFPRLPGVSDLPIQSALPDALRSSSGAPITTASEWPPRRAELRRLLEYYALGHAPPAPGNVRGTELEARQLSNGRYRRVHVSFGPGEQLGLDVGIFTPSGRGPFPAVINPAGTPPGARPPPRLPLGPGQGQGVDALTSVGPGPKPASPAPSPALDAEALARDQPVLARRFAYVVFDHNDCGEDTTLREPDGSWSFRRGILLAPRRICTSGARTLRSIRGATAWASMKTAFPFACFMILASPTYAQAPQANKLAEARLSSAVFEWDRLTPEPKDNGVRRSVLDGPTATVDRLHAHITTLKPGERSGEPKRHLQEEVIIVKEGTIEANFDGQKRTAGPGSVIFFASGAVTFLRNAGRGPATYTVVYYLTPLTPKS